MFDYFSCEYENREKTTRKWSSFLFFCIIMYKIFIEKSAIYGNSDCQKENEREEKVLHIIILRTHDTRECVNVKKCFEVKQIFIFFWAHFWGFQILPLEASRIWESCLCFLGKHYDRKWKWEKRMNSISIFQCFSAVIVAISKKFFLLFSHVKRRRKNPFNFFMIWKKWREERNWEKNV